LTSKDQDGRGAGSSWRRRWVAMAPSNYQIVGWTSFKARESDIHVDEVERAFAKLGTEWGTSCWTHDCGGGCAFRNGTTGAKATLAKRSGGAGCALGTGFRRVSALWSSSPRIDAEIGQVWAVHWASTKVGMAGKSVASTLEAERGRPGNGHWLGGILAGGMKRFPPCSHFQRSTFQGKQ